MRGTEKIYFQRLTETNKNLSILTKIGFGNKKLLEVNFLSERGVGLTTTKKKDEIIIIFRWKQTWNQKFDETGGKEQLGKF